MATLALLSLALGLQVLAGLIPILWEDLNPAKEMQGADAVLKVPRSTPLVLLVTRNDENDRKLEAAFGEALAEDEGAHAEVVTPSLLADLTYQPPGKRGLFGVSPSLFHKWHSRTARVIHTKDLGALGFDDLASALDQVPAAETKVFCALWRPFGRQDWELAAYRRIWQRSSLLLVGVAALVRFAYGEPILRLF